jgi:hypothetical protein
LDVQNGPKIEATVNAAGKMKNIDVTSLSLPVGIFVNRMEAYMVKDRE